MQALLLCNEVHDSALADTKECSLVVSTAAVAHYNRGLLAWQQRNTVKSEMASEELEQALTHAVKV